MASSSNPPGTSVQEYSIRVPKNNKKTYKVMRFNSSVNVDFTKWSQVKMERENNLKEFRGDDEEAPKFGAGSEFGREAREEARRKKYGIISKKYRPEDQPWILKVGGKTGKKFRGTREGGVAENAAYYVFTHAPDGAIEAFPLQEWYNFQPTQRYKALSAEEAEQEFGRRNNQVNYFSLMMRKRLRGEKDDDLDEGEEFKVKGKSKARKGDLKISEMDDWIESSDSSESDEENKEKKEEEKPKKKKNVPVKKKKKRDPDDEAFEESDDGDEEGREVDYISDSSESGSDHETKVTKELKGVEEEDALRKLLSSGEEDEEEEQKEEGEKEEESEEKAKGDLPVLTKDEKDKKSKKKSKDNSSKKKKDDSAGQNQDSSSAASSDSSDSDNDQKKKNFNKGAKETNSGASSRSATPTKDKSHSPAAATVENMKRKAASQESALAKKSRLDNFATAVVPPITGSGESGISEEAVRKYLMRKPMTTTELLQKFKTKKTGLSSDQLVNIMTHILKRIIPTKQTIKGKMYLSIKPQ